jgi:hypothetical protein
MDQIRAGAYAAWRYLIVLYVLVVIVQFFLAGVGVFNPPRAASRTIRTPALASSPRGLAHSWSWSSRSSRGVIG